jgi:hypothetical protein
MTKLNAIKTIHTLIWLVFNVILAYMAYAVIVNRINKWVWIGIGLVLLEGLVLLIFRGNCPLTVVARNYSDSTKNNFDIFLPDWLAKYNKIIYTNIFSGIICMLIFRLVTNKT